MKNYLKSILSLNLIKKIIYKNEYSPITPLNDNVEKRKVLDILGGDLNPDKVFYVIRRYPGTGLFSNLAYVMNHIQIANRMGFIPVVDMKNYPTVYNEKEKILELIIRGNIILKNYQILLWMKFIKVKIY